LQPALGHPDLGRRLDQCDELHFASFDVSEDVVEIVNVAIALAGTTLVVNGEF
jgi:hypothetical protein